MISLLQTNIKLGKEKYWIHLEIQVPYIANGNIQN